MRIGDGAPAEIFGLRNVYYFLNRYEYVVPGAPTFNALPTLVRAAIPRDSTVPPLRRASSAIRTHSYTYLDSMHRRLCSHKSHKTALSPPRSSALPERVGKEPFSALLLVAHVLEVLPQ